MSHDVFISYASEDRKVADEVCVALEAARLRCWMAPRDLVPGAEYASEIVRAIAECRAMVLVFSSHSNRSPLVRRELERAASKGVTIVPLRIEDVAATDAVEFFVSQHHWLDALTPPLAPHLEKLATATMHLVRASYGDAAADPPTRPEPTLLANPQELVGRSVGPYVLRAHRGSGGSGDVYEAWHSELGQKFAVKLLHRSNVPDRTRVALARAVRALAAIDHPGIARIHDFGLAVLDEVVADYVAMEWIEGPSLEAWSRSVAQSPDAFHMRLRVARRMADALAAAHAARYLDENGFELQGLLHGDIKPANVLMRDDATPVFVDFAMMDVQRLLDPRVAAVVQRHKVPITTVMGTLGYMAPEQEIEGVVTVRTDIYSLGVTLGVLFDPERPDGVAPRVQMLPRRLRELLDRMTCPMPEQRPQDSAAVLAVLARIAGDAGVR